MTARVLPRAVRAGAFALAVAVGASTAAAQSISEREAWLAAHTLGTPDAYEWFLELYPAGENAEKARRALAGELAPRFPELTEAAEAQAKAAETQAATPALAETPATGAEAEIRAPEPPAAMAPAPAETPPPRKPEAPSLAAETPAPAPPTTDTRQAAPAPDTALPMESDLPGETAPPHDTAALPGGPFDPGDTTVFEIAPPPLDRERLRELVDSAFDGRPLSGMSYERLSYVAYMLGQTAGLRTEADAQLAAVMLSNALATQTERWGRGLSEDKRQRLAEAVAAGLTRSVTEDAIPVGEGVLLAAALGGMHAASGDLRPAGGRAAAPIEAAPPPSAAGMPSAGTEQPAPDARQRAPGEDSSPRPRGGIEIEGMTALDRESANPGFEGMAAIDPAAAARAEEDGQVGPGYDRRDAESNTWQWARQMGTPEAYRLFLEEYPDSAHREEALAALRDLGEWMPELGEDAERDPRQRRSDRQAEQGGALLGGILRLFGGGGKE